MPICLLKALPYLAVLLVAWFAYKWVDGNGYDRGKTEADAEYTKRDNDALRKASAKIKELNDAARKAERDHAEKVSTISKAYENDLATNKSILERTRSDIAAGRIRLRDPDPGAKCPGSGGGGLSAPIASVGKRDGEAGAELSESATQFLVSEASRSDAIVHQLTAAQQELAACVGMRR